MKIRRSLLLFSALGLSLVATSCQHSSDYHGRHHDGRHHARTTTAVVSHSQYRPGYRVRTLPTRYRTMDYGGSRYYYHNDVYYRPHGGGYVVVDNPRVRTTRTTRTYPSGTTTQVNVVRTLPGGYRTVSHGGVRYYQHGNTYYQPYSGGYRIVASPYGWR